MIDYRVVSEEIKTNIYDKENSNFLYNNLLSRFEYSGLPVSELDLTFLELFLLTRGSCAFWKYGEKYVITPCVRIGNIDEYGLGKDLECVTLNGNMNVFPDFQNSNDVVYIRNNLLGTPDNLTQKDAQSLTEIIKSIDCAVINTRYTKIIAVENENQKIATEKALEKSENGTVQVVVSTNILEDGEAVKTVPINDVRNTDIIQYLHRAYDDVLRRFWNRNGMEVCTTTKLAQQTRDEVTAGHNARLVLSLQMLNLRKKAMADINKKFGLECSVDFSEMWQRELKDTERSEENEI